MPGICRSVTTTSKLSLSSSCQRFDGAGARNRPRGRRWRSTSAIDSRAWAWSSTTSTRPVEARSAAARRVVFDLRAHAAASIARRGKRIVNAAPPSGQLAAVDVAAVGFGDAVDDRQAQAGAAALGREERLERPAADFVGQPGTAVGDFQLDAARGRRTT